MTPRLATVLRTVAVYGAIFLAGAVLTKAFLPRSQAVPSLHHAEPVADPGAAREDRIARGGIDFALLDKTVLPQRPPPEYPAELDRLDGRAVRIAGYMAPYDDLKNLREFMLFGTPAGCYFCAAPTVKQVVFVRQAGPNPRPYIEQPVLVEGTLSLWRPDRTNDAHEAFLFVITNASVSELSRDPP